MAEDSKKADLSSLWGSMAEPAKPEGQSEKPLDKPAETEHETEAVSKTFKPVLPEELQKKELKEKTADDQGGRDQIRKEPSAQKAEKEIIEAEIIEGEKSFGAKLDELLAELNLTRKYLVMLAVGVITVLVVIFFGIKFVASFLEKRKVERPKKAVIAQEKVVEKGKPVQKSILDQSIRAALALAEPVFFPPYFFIQTGLELPLFLGEVKERKDLITTSVIHLKRMRNAYRTDLNQLLNKASDRRAVLQNHLTLLRYLLEQANITVTQLESELTRLTPEAKSLSEKRDNLEKAFFNRLEIFDPNASQDIDAFTDVSRQFVEVRAINRALSEIKNRYNQAIPRFLARITDIELNREALAKGIIVYDVSGSDLELIVPASGGVPESSKRSGVGAGTAITPLDTITHPFLQETTDYIQSPGGGFTQ